MLFRSPPPVASVPHFTFPFESVSSVSQFVSEVIANPDEVARPSVTGCVSWYATDVVEWPRPAAENTDALVVEKKYPLSKRPSVVVERRLLNDVQSVVERHPAALPLAAVQSIARAPPSAARAAVTVMPLVPDTVPVAVL